MKEYCVELANQISSNWSRDLSDWLILEKSKILPGNFFHRTGSCSFIRAERNYFIQKWKVAKQRPKQEFDASFKQCLQDFNLPRKLYQATNHSFGRFFLLVEQGISHWQNKREVRLFFVVALRASLAVLQFTLTALPYADHKTEVLDTLLSIPTHTWAIANKGKLSNERQL